MKEHKSYLDLLRLGAAFCVVLMHTAADGLRYEVGPRPGWLGLAGISSFTFCAVPLFFMMSGYLMLDGDADPGTMLKKRIPRLLIPLLCWSLAHVLLDACVQGSWSVSFFLRAIVGMLQKPANISFWFLYSLIGMYLITPFLSLILNNANDRQRHYLLLLLLLLKLPSLIRSLSPALYAAYFNFDLVAGLSFFDGHLCSFLLGWYIGKAEKRVPGAVLAAAALVCYGVILFGTVRRSLAQGAYIQDFQYQNAFLETGLAAALFALAKRLRLRPEGKAAALLARLAPHSFCVYLSHALLLRVYGSLFDAMPLSMPGIVGLAAAVYGIGIGLGALLCRIPVLRYVALGKRQNRPTV